MAKAPATAQRWTKEWLSDVHALASGLILEVDDPIHGLMRQMGNVSWLASDSDADKKAPCAAADLDALLAEPMRSGNSGDAKGWLEGLKVLDLTNVIAGPTIGSTLVRYGAEVTLVQPVEPSVDPWNTIIFGLHAQRGKESILLDLSSKEGQGALDRLIREADVLTINGTDEQRRKLNITSERLDQLNPSLIVVQLDAFGGPRRGPKSDHLGYDDLAQAATGVMLRFGGGMQTPEEHAHFGTIDVLTGFCACVGLGAALLKRSRDGKGEVARASLAAAGNLIQAQFMVDFDGRAPFDEPSGREAKGWGPFYRCYRASDEWMFFAAPTERGEAFRRVPELEDLSDLSEADLEEKSAERFNERPFAYWRKVLNNGHSAVVSLSSLPGTRDEALQLESEGRIDISKTTFRSIRHDQHPMGRWVDLIAPNAVRPERAPIRIPGPMPKYGEDTRAILTRTGYSEDEVAELIEAGIASEKWSDKYLPE